MERKGRTKLTGYSSPKLCTNVCSLETFTASSNPNQSAPAQTLSPSVQQSAQPGCTIECKLQPGREWVARNKRGNFILTNAQIVAAAAIELSLTTAAADHTGNNLM